MNLGRAFLALICVLHATDHRNFYSQPFRVTPVRQENHILLDLGLTLIAMGLRRKAFKHHSTLDSILNGNDVVLEWDTALLDSPFFCASRPRGMGLDHNRALAYPGFRSFLLTTSEQAGLDRKSLITCSYLFSRF